MATIVDSLIVSFGLDSKNFTKGQKDIISSMKKMEDQSHKTGTEVEKGGKAMAAAFNSLKRELLAVTAIFTSLRGLKNFAIDTIQSTAALGRLSSSLGISKQELAEWQLAAKHAGGSMEDMTSTIEKANDMVAKARLTGDWSAMERSQYYRVDLAKVKTGTDLLKEQADAFKRLREAGVKEGDILFAAHEMGISTGIYNLLKPGKQGVESQLAAQSERARAMGDLADGAERVRKAFDTMFNHLQTIGIKILTHLIDPMEKFSAFIDKMTAEKNPFFKHTAPGVIEILGVKIGSPEARARAKAQEEADKGKNFTRNDWRSTSGAFPGAAGGRDAGARIAAKLEAMGWSKVQAAGIAGSIQQESNFSPNARNPKSGMYGLAQWDTSRRADFKKWSGKNIEGSSEDEQLRFMNYELREGKLQAAGAMIQASNTLAEAAVAHRMFYEKPGAAEANDAARIRFANQIYSGGNVGAAAGMGARARTAGTGGNSVNSSTSSNQVTINGPINVHTQATDAPGIAGALGNAIGASTGIFNLNTGVQ